MNHRMLLDVLQSPAIQTQEENLSTLERGWHNDLIDFAQHELPKLIFILIFAFIVTKIVDFFVGRLRRLADRHAMRDSGRAAQLRTVASILRATAYTVVGFILLLHVLSLFSINLTPLLASAGVVGVGIGLGAQSLFKDMLNGIFILIENQYNVGEVITIAGLTGTVEDLTLRTTTLRDSNGTLYIVPNSNVSTVANVSRDYSVATLSVGVDASADPDKVLSTLLKVSQEIRTDPAVAALVIDDPVVLGVDKFNGREVTYLVNFRVRANQKDPVLRAVRPRLIHAFEVEGIPLGIDPASMFVLQHPNPTVPPEPK